MLLLLSVLLLHLLRLLRCRCSICCFLASLAFCSLPSDVPYPAAAGVSGGPSPASRKACPAVADTSDPFSGFPYLVQEDVRGAEYPWHGSEWVRTRNIVVLRMTSRFVTSRSRNIVAPDDQLARCRLADDTALPPLWPARRRRPSVLQVSQWLRPEGLPWFTDARCCGSCAQLRSC